MTQRRTLLAWLFAILVIAACTAPSGQLADESELASAQWLELDLADGALQPVSAPDEHRLAASRWRSTHILFRRIPSGSTRGRSSALPAGGEPEDAQSLDSPVDAYLAIFELTRSQWAGLQGQPPPSDPALPATGVAMDEVATVIARLRPRHFRLVLPTAGLWARGCAAGNSGLFTWGDSSESAVSATYAVLHAPTAPPTGPATVGGRLPNAFGLYDTHGNAWEGVRSGDGYAACGGAWDSAPIQARTANQIEIDGELQHPSVGVRLALMP